jgi:hypothetical protein
MGEEHTAISATGFVATARSILGMPDFFVKGKAWQILATWMVSMS